MDFVTELHTHSLYAGSCSPRLTLENMRASAQQKGIDLISTADFTHPEWFKEIKGKLEEAEPGLFKLKNVPDTGRKVRFFLGTEVNVIFSNSKAIDPKLGMFDRTGTVKRFHNCILAPSMEVVEQMNSVFSKYADLKIDARPTLKLRASELVEILHQIDKRIIVFPAHVWTPWFGIFGSLSGFDSVKEAYEDQDQHIYAIETGLSSDPSNNWRLSALDKYAIVSGSDAHSPEKLGREATILQMEKLSFEAITDAIKSKKISSTIEFFPEEGKYHYDGHKKCNLVLSPEQAKKYNNICPVCRKPLTLGVMHRINDLADREEGFVPKGSVPFVHAIPLREIIAFVTGKGEGTSYVEDAYKRLVSKFGTERDVLLKTDLQSLKAEDEKVGEAIGKVRSGRVYIKPGYDGVFGVIDVLSDSNTSTPAKKQSQGQRSMGDF